MADYNKPLDGNGLLLVQQTLKSWLKDKVDKTEGKGLSTNDYTTDDKNAVGKIGSKLDKTGDGSDVTAAFTAAATRTNISTGEKLSVMLGKIAKWFSDLHTVAFSGKYDDLTGTPTIPTVTNDLTDELKKNYDAAYTHSTTAHAPASAQANVIETVKVNGTAQTVTGKAVDITVPTVTNDLTDALKKNYDEAYTHSTTAHAPSNAQANVIESIKVNGTAQTVTGKAVDITVPTTVAQLTDAGQYAKKSDITRMYRYQGSVDTLDDLPTTGLTAGDVYDVKASGMNYAWTEDGTWDALGQMFTIEYLTNEEIAEILAM